MSLPETTLYERIGGAETIATLVDSFYAKVTADPELKHYFAKAPMDKLLRMQKEFFSSATGGPITYSGRPLSQVHRGMDISKREFGRFTEHLIETLKEVGVAESDAYDIICKVNLYADEITNDVDSGGD
ncbi:MAG: group 1 truncated hemoglobin [Verrucomicrobiales bacterium]|jgi:hemoglobin|nr:group 1 truncated hemoglobin [Verrucomicrobiales bacterium]